MPTHLQCFNEWEKVLVMLRDPKFSPTNSRRKDTGSPTYATKTAEEEASGETTSPKTSASADFERSESPDLFT